MSTDHNTTTEAHEFRQVFDDGKGGYADSCGFVTGYPSVNTTDANYCNQPRSAAIHQVDRTNETAAEAKRQLVRIDRQLGHGPCFSWVAEDYNFYVGQARWSTLGSYAPTENDVERLKQLADVITIFKTGHCGAAEAPLPPSREETDEEYEERTRPRIVNPPARIWLQTGCNDEIGEIDWSELARDEVSWCWERIDNTDIEYILLSAHNEEVAGLRASATTLRDALAKAEPIVAHYGNLMTSSANREHYKVIADECRAALRAIKGGEDGD